MPRDFLSIIVLAVVVCKKFAPGQKFMEALSVTSQ